MSNNVFGITFRGSLTELTNNAYGTQFYSACNTFGLNPFASAPPAPKAPDPFAEYDFNTYTANDATIADLKGGADANIIEPTLNFFETSTAGNFYLDIYAPNNFPNPTGGIILPSLSNIKAIEAWVNYPTAEGYGQYVLDARTGATNGFWITPGDTIGSDWDTGKFYNNTVGTAIDSAGATPNVSNEIAGLGWRQLFFVPPAPITDDIAMFIKHIDNIQGMPISVAYIGLYNVDLLSTDVIDIFNSKCARYGLSPV
jgi:hypothetical protein